MRYLHNSVYVLIGLIMLFLCLHTLAASPTIDVTRTESVFVYGTLKSPLIRMLTCRCRVASTPAVVEGFRKIGRNIVPDQTSSVIGKVILVNEEELARLDAYERVPRKYIRTTITDTSGSTHFVYQLK